MPPFLIRQLSAFLRKKTGFVGTVLSTRSVLWASNMQRMRWRLGLRWGSSRRSPDLLVGWGGGMPSPIPTPLFVLSFCGPLNVKSWLRPWMDVHASVGFYRLHPLAT